MTETPRDPAQPDEWSAEAAAAPAPPPPGSEPPAGGAQPPVGSQPPPAPAGSQPPPGYAPPPAYQPPAPDAAAPAAQPVTPDQPAVGQYPPAGYGTPPAAGYQEPGGYQAAPAGYGGRPAFDPRAVNPLDWGIIAAGVVAFIFSLFDFYKYTVTIGPISRSGTASAWHGFFGWFGVLVAVLASLLLAVELFAHVRLPFATRIAVLGGYVVALICELLALLIVPGDTGGLNGALGIQIGIKIDKGHSFGYWIALIAVIVGTALAYKRYSDVEGNRH